MVRTVDIINKFPPQEKDFSFPEVEELSAPSRDTKLKTVRELYESARENLFGIFQLVKNKEDLSVRSINSMIPYVNDFVSHLQREDDPLIQLVYREEKEDEILLHIVVHSLNVAIVAIKTGIELKFGNDKLKKLAMLAFFHDVGMIMVPPEIPQKKGKLTSEEISILRKHPEYGYEIILKIDRIYENLANEIYQEHERWDGSGYPKGLRGEEISENSIIIGISDIYASLVSPRYHRARFLPFEAVKEIISTSKEQFPQRFIRGLINEFSAFPQGIYVRLNSGEVGRVIATKRFAPLRPVVEILYDADGQRMQSPKIVDMVKDNIFQITSAYFEEEGTDLR
jgi:HD-GYP domain-containing protein (c-di-GMP phosphodiesterase class II)